MPYGQRGTRYYSREAVREESRLFSSASEFKVRVGPGSFPFIRVKSTRVEPGPCATPPRTRTGIGLNPASRSLEHACGAVDA